ncbi:hypothetical protein D9M69_326730 [compost metagenome]
MVGQEHPQHGHVAHLADQGQRRVLDQIVDHRLVGQQADPLRITLGQLASHDLDERRERVGCRHTGLLAQLPFEAIDLLQQVVAHALPLWRGDHDDEHIAGVAEMRGDVGVVPVVARVGAQLWRPRIEVADLQVQADHETEDAQSQRRNDGGGGDLAFGELIEKTPQRMADATAHVGLLVTQTAHCGLAPHPDIAEHNGQQDQIGEDQEGHAYAGSGS